MKKIIYITILILFIFIMPVMVCAKEDTHIEDFRESINNSLFSIMDDDLEQSFEKIGINSLDFEKIYYVSINDVLLLFTPEIVERGKLILNSSMRLLAIIMLMGAFSIVVKESSQKNCLLIFGTAIAILISVNSISSSINSCLFVLKISGTFMIGFIPILTLLISFSGNLNTAVAYNAITITASELISAFINNGFIDLIGCFICVGIALSVGDVFDVNKLVHITNKTVNFIFGIAGGLFSGFLSFKGLMAVSVDSVSQKGIRFLISSLIPVVGSTINDAYASLMGSISLIKGSVALVGILAVLIINLPVIAEMLMYKISFSLLSFFADVFSCNSLSKYFSVVSCAIKMLFMAVVFEMFVLLISTGIMISLKGVL